MNERIRKLAEQAANEYLSEMESATDTLSTAKRNELAQKAKQAGIGIIPHGFSEKFAELIVLECLTFVRPNSYFQAYPDNMIGGEDGVRLLETITNQIKEHFGVES